MVKDVQHLSMCLLDYLHAFFGKMSTQFFTHFLIGLFNLLDVELYEFVVYFEY